MKFVIIKWRTVFWGKGNENLFLHTPPGILELAGQTGFEIIRIEHCSGIEQFTYSEWCLRNQPLQYAKRDFTKVLNNIHEGDVACFFLYKK